MLSTRAVVHGSGLPCKHGAVLCRAVLDGVLLMCRHDLDDYVAASLSLYLVSAPRSTLPASPALSFIAAECSIGTMLVY